MNVESFKIDDWEDLQTGIILLENSDWLLTKYITSIRLLWHDEIKKSKSTL
jgi:hypothetical protein